LLAEFQQFEGEDPHRLNQALSVAHHCAPALYSADQLNALPFYRQLRRLHNFLLRYPTLRSFFFRKRFLIPTLVTFFLCFFPWSHDLTGDCTIYPIQRVQVVSEVSGILNHIYVQNGQAVSAQQPLAQLDDLEIRRQLEVLGQEANRYRTEADHYRSLDNRAQARIAEMNLERVRSQIAFWQDQLRKTTLRAPMEGILYAPQLKEALGTLIQPGTQLAIVGVPSSWELVIKVPESDIALLTSRLLKGQSLSVRFLLSSLPTQKFHAQITSLSQVSPIAEVIKNRNCFQIRVPLPPSDSQQKFRYGFEGRAKIHLGTLPAGYLLMRAFLNWLRIHVLL
ncbi:MAG: efflux RND transporter periplasmic adaptor subunit, partial [Chthoniobacterales bacterium]|nr:efflux RND transporter periplasmic adaptor subunit [Chthoniobacterales bacterium]